MPVYILTMEVDSILLNADSLEKAKLYAEDWLVQSVEEGYFNVVVKEKKEGENA